MKKEQIDEILKPVSTEEMDARAEDIRSKFWGKLKGAASRLPYIEELLSMYYCAMDPQTPTKVRGILLAGLAYFILPIDLVPDFLAGFGFSDDIAVLTYVYSSIKSHITPVHKQLAKEALQELKKKPECK